MSSITSHLSDLAVPITPHEQVSRWSGRQIVNLPPEYMKSFEKLGIEWLEDSPSKPLVRALLPRRWQINGTSSDGLRIIDDQNAIRVKMQKIGTDRFSVSFLSQPVHYPGYYFDLYCTYEEIVGAIASWGSVKAILMSDRGFNHVFLVAFKQPIRCSCNGMTVTANLADISDTPFTLRPSSPKQQEEALSSYRMVFDICFLRRSDFNTAAIAQRCIPDNGLSEKEKLLEWIKQSGLAILQRGVYLNGKGLLDSVTPIEQIIDDYVEGQWQIVFGPTKDITYIPRGNSSVG